MKMISRNFLSFHLIPQFYFLLSLFSRFLTEVAPIHDHLYYNKRHDVEQMWMLFFCTHIFLPIRVYVIKRRERIISYRWFNLIICHVVKDLCGAVEMREQNSKEEKILLVLFIGLNAYYYKLKIKQFFSSFYSRHYVSIFFAFVWYGKSYISLFRPYKYLMKKCVYVIIYVILRLKRNKV
jgi:hypothetical protein